LKAGEDRLVSVGADAAHLRRMSNGKHEAATVAPVFRRPNLPPRFLLSR
jgi:hypothetical protein